MPTLFSSVLAEPPEAFDDAGAHHPKFSPEDFAAFTDARIAALKVGLKLTPTQEKNWPALEAALREHPTHAVRFACGWIKKGGRMEIPTNGSQRRLNILGALDLEDMAIHTQEYETINADAIIAFLSYLLSILPGLVLHIILDQARYHTCAAVEEWAAKNPRIKLHFLPAYSPNLNTIERVWKIMHEHTVNNAYSPTFKTFTEKIRCFFTYTFPKNAPLWVGRLTDNFTPRYSPLLANS